MRVVVARLSGFTLLPLIGLVLPLLLFPAMSRVVGAQGWNSALAGMSLGSFAAAAIQWGWNVDGPVLIARATTDAERGAIYRRSLSTRILLAAVFGPLALLIAGLIAVPGHVGSALATTVATALAGLSPAWFGVGVGSPRLLALYDTLPRSLATLVAVPAVMGVGNLWPYPVLVAFATIVSLAIFGRHHAPGRLASGSGVWHDIVHQRHTAGYNLAGASYAATPLPITNALMPGASAAPFGSTDQLYRYGLFGVIALGNAVQSWTLEPGIPRRRSRHLAAIGAHALLGVLGLATLVVAGPPVGALLFGADKAPTVPLCLAYGIAYLFLSLTTPLSRNLLIPAGRQRYVLTVTIVSAVVGLGVMLAAGSQRSLVGIAAGMAASECVMFIAQLPPAWRLIQESSHE